MRAVPATERVRSPSLLFNPALSFLRRVFDVMFASACLIVAVPLYVVVALLIKVEDGGPVFFLQDRTGKDGRTFRIFKFRSMTINNYTVHELGQVREDHPLVTRVGRVIRRLKIDELPQLLNVLCGDLSIIGPRPTIPEQVQEYDRLQRRRLWVRPGLTGWAQVSGGSRLSWDDRINLDIWYIDHWTPVLDLLILVKTVSVILRSEIICPEVVTKASAYVERLRTQKADEQCPVSFREIRS